jgi:hypothetical protein
MMLLLAFGDLFKKLKFSGKVAEVPVEKVLVGREKERKTKQREMNKVLLNRPAEEFEYELRWCFRFGPFNV